MDFKSDLWKKLREKLGVLDSKSGAICIFLKTFSYTSNSSHLLLRKPLLGPKILANLLALLFFQISYLFSILNNYI